MPRAQPAHPTGAASRWPGVLAWSLWAVVLIGMAAFVWLAYLLREAGDAAPSGMPYLLTAVSAGSVGAVVASRRPRHPVGWLLLALGVSPTMSLLSDAYAQYVALVQPEARRAASYLAVFSNLDWVGWLTCISFILLLTPTGSLPSPRWRWWARITAVAPAAVLVGSTFSPQPLDPPFEPFSNPLAVPALEPLLVAVRVPGELLLVLAVVVAGVSVVVRFRRARGVERQQLRWVMVGAVVFLTGLLGLIEPIADRYGLVDWLAEVWLAAPPLAIGAAILQYRLFDLDRIVSRTIAYGLLTVLLGASYVAVVLALGAVLGEEGGRSSLVVAGATLAVAAAFQPARRRIQDAVDRRFNRRRYDAERTIAAFSGRLRQQTDLDTLTAELLAVVDQTMQPTHAGLWLRPAADRGRGGPHARG